MNYKEFEKANKLYEEINEINDFLKIIKSSNMNVKVSTDYRTFGDFKVDEIVCFNGKHKEKIIEVIEKIKDEMVKKLNELGVTEYGSKQ